MAALISANCASGNFPNRRISACWSMLAKPWMFTAECFGSQRGLPMSTSPRRPRNCYVSGTTTTSARASAGCG